jgi:hypothetical protein
MTEIEDPVKLVDTLAQQKPTIQKSVRVTTLKGPKKFTMRHRSLKSVKTQQQKPSISAATKGFKISTNADHLPSNHSSYTKSITHLEDGITGQENTKKVNLEAENMKCPEKMTFSSDHTIAGEKQIHLEKFKKPSQETKHHLEETNERIEEKKAAIDQKETNSERVRFAFFFQNE